jgi:methylated-DNA-[protein]-cysteine S-methyltransferase
MKSKKNLFYASAKIAGINFKIFSTPKGIYRITLNNKEKIKSKKYNLTKLHPDDPYMFNIFYQLEEYFNGDRKKFNVPLDIEGTDFQKKVWGELIKIPYGKTATYKKIAEKLGKNKAFRAVGKVNSTNPLCIVIPCHRVIGSNGKLGGYSAGINIKEKLLELEGSLSMELFEASP